MIKISEICVSVYICLGRENSQHSMLENPEYFFVSIDNYYQEIFQTYVLKLYVFATISLTFSIWNE